MAARNGWRGVFPAMTTQFRPDHSLDIAATQRVARGLIDDGVDGIIACGSVGENSVLSQAEKLEVVGAVREAAGGRVPVLSGVAEITTKAATDYARDLARQGCDGLMVMPPMIYDANARELVAWFDAIASASDLPIMLYNNPPAYRNDITPAMAQKLSGIGPIVAIKESSGDTRRYVDLVNTLGDRFALFCGLDDVVLEAVALGAVGWVSGLSNVFPRESVRLFELCSNGGGKEALALYRWFMPLLHLDARPDLVQCIKLCEQIAGRGSAMTRPPRLVPDGAGRAEIEAVMRQALDTRPNV